MQLSEDQIIKLAPDAASVKAGKGLASAAKWVLRGASDRALWGHCQGSGKNPYQTQVDLQNIAFKCSCPSHKFPCKHSLGLLFLYASQPDLFTTGEEPDLVKEWLEKRAWKKRRRRRKKADKPCGCRGSGEEAGGSTQKGVERCGRFARVVKGLCAKWSVKRSGAGAMPALPAHFQANGRCTGSRFGGDDAAVTGDSLFR
ncbi:MAG: SWIM zinc finger family protein [Butyricimonas faecihominis]